MILTFSVAQAAQTKAPPAFQLVTGDIFSAQFSLIPAFNSTAAPSAQAQLSFLDPLFRVDYGSSAQAALRRVKENVAEAALVPDYAVFNLVNNTTSTFSSETYQLFALINPLAVVIVANPAAGIQNSAGLIGKRLVLGPTQSDREQESIWVLSILGIPINTYTALSANSEDQILALLTQHQADAAIFYIRDFTPMLANAIKANQLSVVPFSSDQLETILTQYPYLKLLHPTLMGWGTVDTFGVSTLVVGSSRLTDTRTTQLLQAMKNRPLIEMIDPTKLKALPLPLNKSAQNFYQPPDQSVSTLQKGR